jgi:predicted phosphoribosyltransferase
MKGEDHHTIIEKPEFRDRFYSFSDRTDAGRILAELLTSFHGSDAMILAIPAGGVEVAVAVAKELDLHLDVAVVNKITPPWSTEVGYGAVAWDGTVLLNEALLPAMRLSDGEIREGIQHTRQKVQRRVSLLREDSLMPDLTDRTVILIDDGLASGYTMRAAVEAVKKVKPAELIVAVPTAPLRVARELAGVVDRLYCVNLRTAWDFAVADAYEHWSDVPEEQVIRTLSDFLAKSSP